MLTAPLKNLVVSLTPNPYNKRRVFKTHLILIAR